MLKRLLAVLCVPIMLFSLVTGTSFITKEDQKFMNRLLDIETQADFEPVFRFAIASDVHISTTESIRTERFAKLFQSAYRYSDGHKTYKSLDAVLLAGDNCDTGSDEEYAILNRVVKENIRPETQFITIMGNHEFKGTGHEGYVRNMGESLDKHVVVKGFHIIGLSPDPSGTKQSAKQMIWLSKELKKANDDDPNKPIFTMQHGHIWNTVYVSRSWFTRASASLHMVYSQYPQVVNFSGHSHGPINNPLNIWQCGYTLLGTGSLKYVEMEEDIGDNTTPDGCENTAQFLIVEVDAKNRVRIQPYNLITDDFFRTPANNDDPDKQLIWQIDNVTDPSEFAYTSTRKKTCGLPWFDNDAAVTVEQNGDKATVSFPQAIDDFCPYGYRISLYDKASPKKPVKENEIYSEFYLEPMPETLNYTFGDLIGGKTYTVKVTPLSVWGEAGAPISTDFTVR
ncbi:MAG: metallophosphoesterase [Clostridiales bacterium]|nr:metallophosphoesterase [Clostridiales bacterium]